MKNPKNYYLNTRLTEQEDQIIRELAEREFEGNTSQAVRKIIREYDRTKKEDCKDSRPTG